MDAALRTLSRCSLALFTSGSLGALLMASLREDAGRGPRCGLNFAGSGGVGNLRVTGALLTRPIRGKGRKGGRRGGKGRQEGKQEGRQEGRRKGGKRGGRKGGRRGGRKGGRRGGGRETGGETGGEGEGREEGRERGICILCGKMNI